MDQKQSDDLRARWIAKEKRKKNIIILVVCLVVLLIFSGAVIFLFLLAGATEDDNGQKVLITNKTSETTTAYGVEMQNKCFSQFENFVKTNGSDYSKCLADVEFNKDYCSGLNPDTQALSDVNIIVILDSSGSMAEKVNSEVKIAVAKKAVSDFLTKMPQGVKTGLVVYGHKGSNSIANKNLSCAGIEEIVKLAGNNGGNIIAAMNSFSPKGWTPIAGSLDFARNIFKSNGENNKNYLILVSDGVESCGGDPLIAAENLKLEVPGVKFILIGFAINFETRELLTKIATRAGGSYLTANNSSEIAKAFNDQLLVIKKDCIKMTLLKASLMNDANNLNNLNCWLSAYKKEADDFTDNVSRMVIEPECTLEVAEALKGRHTEAWYKKQELEGKNSVIYKEIELDLNKQLEALQNFK